MKNKIRTSIVIRTHNHAKMLRRLLEKIEMQKNFKNYEILVIDSSSSDGTAELAKKKGCVVISINPKKFSHAYTFNLGAEKSKGEIILYTSVDVIPKNDSWAHDLVKYFKDKKIAGVFSKQEPIKNFNPIEEFKINKMFPSKGSSPAFFSNASGAIRKSIWEKIKYDEQTPYQHFGGEDQQLMVDVKKLGYIVVYEPKSRVYHSHKYSLKTRINEAYQIGLNEKEIKKWEEKIFILNYKKKDLVKYLVRKGKFKSLIWDLLIGGVLLRVAKFFGRLKRILK